MNPALYFWLTSAVLTIALAANAWKNGVAALLWGVAGVLTGIVGGAAIYHFALSAIALEFPVKLAIAFFGGLIVYLPARWIAKRLLCKLFEIDGPLHSLCDGLPAAVLSLIPSLLTILIIATGIRIGGTLAELRRLELLATPKVDFLARDYPRRPLAAEWRDSIESTPGLRAGMDWIEPLGRLPERQLAALLIASKKPELLLYFSESPETQSVIAASAFQRLLADEAVKDLNANGQRIELLRHPDLRAAALDPELAPKLPGIPLHRMVDDFLLSVGRQSVIESYQRSPEDKASSDQ